MKWDLVRLVGGTLLGAVAMLVVLPACAGSAPAASAPKVTATAAQPAPTAAPAPTPTAAPAPTSTAALAPTPKAGAPQPANPQPGNDPLALGKLVFEKTAGGVGCAYCHGMDGKGQGPSGLNAPNIQGKQAADVRDAIKNMAMMSIVKLNDQEIAAVAAYLQVLAQQP